MASVTGTRPRLLYFKLRGRGETIRLALTCAGVDYDDTGLTDGVDFQSMKAGSGTADWPFGQCPAFEDGDFKVAQSDAILRYVGRKYGMYGKGIQEETLVDTLLIGIEDLRRAYLQLIYGSKLDPTAHAEFYKKHIDPATKAERNGGAHFAYLDAFLKRNNGGAGFVVGGSLTIADVQLFDLVDLFLRDALFPEQMQSAYPALVAHHGRFAAIPAVSTYLASPRRLQQINANGLG